MEVYSVVLVVCFLSPPIAAFPNYPGDNAPTEELVAYYFQQGYRVADICGFLLLCHGTVMSVSTLKRTLRRLRLRRNNVEENLPDIVRRIIHLQRNGFLNAGYKTLWKLLNAHYGIRVTQNTVRLALQGIDQEGVLLRSHQRLRRRVYVNKGPNFLVHVDGYDKLKPYGIAIHGAIDGFSRKILWLKAGPSNNNPYYVTRFYFDFIKRIRRFPRCIRVDRGTENVLIVDLQLALWHCSPTVSDAPPILTGRSTSNQRIERFWGSLRSILTGFWMDYFKDMRDSGVLNDSDIFNINCIRFCYLRLIQTQLDKFQHMWNSHRIRKQRNRETPSGIPNVLYEQPEVYDTRDFSYEIPCAIDVIHELRTEYSKDPPLYGCTEECLQLIELLTDTNRLHLEQPNSEREAKLLFSALIECYNAYL